MAHHKRHRRKDARAGCLLCKPQKANGAKGTRGALSAPELRAVISEEEQLREFFSGGDRESDDVEPEPKG